MTSSLLHLPSRASPSPTPSSSSLRQIAPGPAASLPPASSPGTSSIPGTVSKKKQSSLTSFLSPAAKQQQPLSLAGSATAAHSEDIADLVGGHSHEFIEQSWQQRLHGRQPQPPPVIVQQPVSKKQQQQQQQQHKTAAGVGAVTKERGVKRPLEFPEDISSLLPPEWGGQATKPDKLKVKGKPKGKVSLTAQYLHPDTLQHASTSAMQNRPAPLSSAPPTPTTAATAVEPQQQPHTRPHAAAAVASAHSRFESQQAQQVQQAQQAQQTGSSNVPWFSSNKATISPVKTAHSFGDWLQPPWGQSHRQPPAQHVPTSSLHQGRPSGPDSAALPLPVKPNTPSEQRLGQLAAMHHKRPMGVQIGDYQATTKQPSTNGRGAPPSRSPSPVLMEDDEFDTRLGPTSGSAIHQNSSLPIFLLCYGTAYKSRIC